MLRFRAFGCVLSSFFFFLYLNRCFVFAFLMPCFEFLNKCFFFEFRVFFLMWVSYALFSILRWFIGLSFGSGLDLFSSFVHRTCFISCGPVVKPASCVTRLQNDLPTDAKFSIIRIVWTSIFCQGNSPGNSAQPIICLLFVLPTWSNNLNLGMKPLLTHFQPAGSSVFSFWRRKIRFCSLFSKFDAMVNLEK